jgi:TRAP-type C4-dicarboxylate transport system permease small subunit
VTAPRLTHPLLRALALAENALITVLLAGTALVLLAQVFFRYALSRPLSWSTEVATDLLAYIALVGFAIGVRDNAHVALDVLESRLGAQARRWLRVAELLVLTAVLVALGVGAIWFAQEQSTEVSPAGIPLWWVIAALPLGCGLGSLHALVEIVALLRGAEAPGFAPPEAEHEPGEPVPVAAVPGGAE